MCPRTQGRVQHMRQGSAPRGRHEDDVIRRWQLVVEQLQGARGSGTSRQVRSEVNNAGRQDAPG